VHLILDNYATHKHPNNVKHRLAARPRYHVQNVSLVKSRHYEFGAEHFATSQALCMVGVSFFGNGEMLALEVANGEIR
jgi:hypothetical protein